MRYYALTIGLLCLLAGCGGSGDKYTKNRAKTVPASGFVKFNGQPVEGATVVFAPTAEKGIAASALTDAEGKFSLMAYPPLRGAVPGSYKVAITKMDPPPPPRGPEAHDQPPPPAPKSHLPEKFADPDKSGLRADVPEGGRDDLNFELP